MRPLNIKGHTRPISMVRYSREGDLLFTSSQDGAICIWRTQNGEQLGRIKPGSAAVAAFALSYDCEIILSATVTEGLFVFKTKTGEQINTIDKEFKTQRGRGIDLSYGDKEVLFLVEKEGASYIRIFPYDQVKTKNKEVEVRREFKAAQKGELVLQATWGPLNKTIYCSTNKGRIFILDAQTGEQLKSEKPHFGQVLSFSFSKDQIMLLTCSKEGNAFLMDAESLKCLKEFKNAGKPIRCGDISPLYDHPKIRKFHVLVAGGQDAKEVTTTAKGEGGFEVRLYNFIQEQELAYITGHFGTVHTLKFSPDGSGFASGSEDGIIRLNHFPPSYYSKKFD